MMLNADTLDKHTLETTLTVLLKHESDVQKAKRALTRPTDGDDRNRRSRGFGQRGSWPN